jgi:hypothetical protein
MLGDIETNPTTVKGLDALAAQICAAHQAVRHALGNALDHAIVAGAALLEAQGRVNHGENGNTGCASIASSANALRGFTCCWPAIARSSRQNGSTLPI